MHTRPLETIVENKGKDTTMWPIYIYYIAISPGHASIMYSMTEREQGDHMGIHIIHPQYRGHVPKQPMMQLHI